MENLRKTIRYPEDDDEGKSANETYKTEEKEMERFLGKCRYKIGLKKGRRRQEKIQEKKQQRKKQKMTTALVKSCTPFVENCNISKE